MPTNREDAGTGAARARRVREGKQQERQARRDATTAAGEATRADRQAKREALVAAQKASADQHAEAMAQIEADVAARVAELQKQRRDA